MLLTRGLRGSPLFFSLMMSLRLGRLLALRIKMSRRPLRPTNGQ
jgi:hypothetical protein